MLGVPALLQIVIAFADIGAGLIVTVTVSLFTQPAELVAETMYCVVIVGFTVIEAVVAPVLHNNVPVAVAVKVVGDPPQISTSAPALIVGKGLTFTITGQQFPDTQPEVEVKLTE